MKLYRVHCLSNSVIHTINSSIVSHYDHQECKNYTNLSRRRPDCRQLERNVAAVASPMLEAVNLKALDRGEKKKIFKIIAPFLTSLENKLFFFVLIIASANLQISQLLPRLLGGQMHLKFPIPSMHVEPSAHGCDAHSLMLIWHVSPSKPGAHLQRNHVSPDSQVPLFMHGLDAHKSVVLLSQFFERHSLISISHNVPLYPASHMQ